MDRLGLGVIMKFLLSLFLLIAVSTFGAVPSYTVFRGSGGITIVSNPPTGTIVIDGSGVTTGTNAAAPPFSSVQFNSNGVMRGSSGFVFTNGNVGIGTATPSSSLDVTGQVRTASVIITNLIEVGTGNYLFSAASAFYINGTGNGLILQTGGADRWLINSSGHFLASADNTYDDGAAGANRKRHMHIAGAIVQGFSLTAPIAPTVQGAAYWNDGTNVCVVLRNGAGTLTTNKLSMTAWP